MAVRCAKRSISTSLRIYTLGDCEQSRCQAIGRGQSKHQAFLRGGWSEKRNETGKPFQIPSQLTPKEDLKHPCVHRASKHLACVAGVKRGRGRRNLGARDLPRRLSNIGLETVQHG